MQTIIRTRSIEFRSLVNNGHQHIRVDNTIKILSVIQYYIIGSSKMTMLFVQTILRGLTKSSTGLFNVRFFIENCLGFLEG